MPVRSCVACGREGEKSTFLRIVRTPDGKFETDDSLKAAGRGAYICPDAKCVKLAKKKQSLGRSFKTKVPGDIYDGLLGRFE